MTTISALSSINPYLKSILTTDSTTASNIGKTASSTSTTASTTSKTGSNNSTTASTTSKNESTTSTTTTRKENAMKAARETIATTSLSLFDDSNSGSLYDSSSFFEDSASISEQAQALLDKYTSSS